MQEMRSLEDLLDLQRIDSEIDGLLDERQSLPELDEYRQAHEAGTALVGQIDEKQQQLTELNRKVDKGEGEMEILEEKKTVEERRMYAGGISARDLQHLQDELAQIGHQIETYEEQILASLDEKEQLEGTLAELRESHEATTAEENRLEGVISERWKRIDSEIARQEDRKETVIKLIPAELVELYERIRPAKEGVAAARFADRVCGGCHLTLSAAEEIEVLKEDPPRCLHCRRILVPQ